jgi:alkylresorcinol/alkylpyrone synthase
MSTIAAVAPVLPEQSYPQGLIAAELATMLVGGDDGRAALLARLHGSMGITRRHLALPLERYPQIRTFTEANDAFIALGTELAERAARRALADARLSPGDVDFLLFTSVTGVSAPSIDALLVGRLGMRPDVKRMPSFGLGCAGGAASLARVHDYLVGHPDDVALLVSVELCSLTLQHDDPSTANIVASGLFGDGAAAVVVLGARRAGPWRLEVGEAAAAAPAVIDTRSRIYPDSEGDLGWHVGSGGFRIVLSPRLPDVIEGHLADDVADFLYPHGLKAGDIPTWVAHAGGPKILDATARALDLPAGLLDQSWASLADCGNLSSSSVLHVLARTMAARSAPPGSEGVLLAFGPGVCAELVLLRWPERP